MHIRRFKSVYPNLKLVSSPESFFGTVKHQYPEYSKSGFFNESKEEGLYVYEITSSLGKFTGIIACTHISDFIENRVLKHEKTLAAKEQQMMSVVLQNKAMVKPILLGYNPVDAIDAWMESVKTTPSYFEIVFEEVVERHTVWAVTDVEKLNEIEQLFEENIPQSYIADGHHRTSTAVSLLDNDYKHYGKESLSQVLSVYFSFDQLRIYDYNRVLDVLKEVDAVEFIVQLSEYCKIKVLDKPRKPKKKHEMTLYLNKKWYQLKWKKKVLRLYADNDIVFDAELFNRFVLGNICNVENVRTDKRIKYVDGVSGIIGVEHEVSKSSGRLGVCLYPISKDELKFVAENNGTLPPKSTWFEPRIKNGMIVKAF